MCNICTKQLLSHFCVTFVHDLHFSIFEIGNCGHLADRADNLLDFLAFSWSVMETFTIA